MKSKRIKNLTTKKYNLISTTQSRVSNNSKTYQLKVEMQEKKNSPKKKFWEREITLCV